MTMTKEERQQQREEYRETLEWERTQHQQQIVEQNRREDLIAERDLWAGTVQIGLEDSMSLTASIMMADGLLEAYRARFQ